MRFDIDVKNVYLEYNDCLALKDISFSLSQGKIYGLVGRNGAGKTSLLSLLASFNYPTSGSIKISGEEVFENGKIISQISYINDYIYDDTYNSPELSFKFAERYRPNFDRKYAEDLSRYFNFPLNKSISDFSRGKQSAFNVTMGLATRSPITIFDEIYLNMDAATRELFYNELLREQNESPRLFILSTHLVSEMNYLFDHVLILNHGELIINEAYDEVIERGASIIGKASVVDNFVTDMKILNKQQLGGTKSVMIYGELSQEKISEAEQKGLEIGPVSLQDLFIHLTQEERNYDIKK
ncbi:ATP-binding cassette domain-containing protein [Natronospora cellulosivora (SeqCode)]